MVTRHHFDKAIAELNEEVLALGRLISIQIAMAVGGLADQDLDRANQVIAGDMEINDVQAKIEEKCMLLIATQQPSARDLRKIVAAFKISIFLERMGDLASDIAKTTIRMSGESLIKPLIDLPRMSDIVRKMIDKGLKAYQTEDQEMALEMAQMDDEVDHLYNQIFRELIVFMLQDPKTIKQATHLIFIGRFLERIGDYCTNIAEEVQYIVTAKRTDMNI